MSRAHGQEVEKKEKVLIVTGDIHTPYDVVDAVALVKEVAQKVTLFGSDVVKSYNNTLAETFKELERIALKAGGDAIINLRLQFVVIPIQDKGVIHELLAYGTLVKFKTINNEPSPVTNPVTK